jgi:hypothetical protein
MKSSCGRCIIITSSGGFSLVALYGLFSIHTWYLNPPMVRIVMCIELMVGVMIVGIVLRVLEYIQDYLVNARPTLLRTDLMMCGTSVCGVLVFCMLWFCFYHVALWCLQNHYLPPGKGPSTLNDQAFVIGCFLAFIVPFLTVGACVLLKELYDMVFDTCTTVEHDMKEYEANRVLLLQKDIC